jgi:hypothetical protein
MSKLGRVVIPILAAGAALYIAGWFDGTVMHQIQTEAGRAYDPNPLMLAISIGSLAVAGSVLLLGALAWLARSTLVGAIYTTVGALVAFLPVIVWRFAAQINDSPPFLPQPIANEIDQIYSWSSGPLNAMGMIGAGMFVAGILVIARSYRGRSADPVGEAQADPLNEPDELPARP